tara:strand:- start:638 stop:961 length:324 start_codon:yes stop_codon:yes gene_type:complete
VTRLGLLLLLCSLSLLIVRNGYDELRGAELLDHGDPATLNTFVELVESPPQDKDDTEDDHDESWPGSASSTQPAGVFGSVGLLSDGREQLPATPEYLHARLRAPPFA